MTARIKAVHGAIPATVLGALVLFTSTTAYAGEVVDRGAVLFRKCIHCHTIDKGGKHRIGPNLFGIFGRKAGDIDDFDFSEAWKKADFVWDDETMDRYLKAPHEMIPNNRMPFDGLNRPEDRKALIVYMKKVLVDEPTEN